jgi:hypothetical protein
MDSNYIHLGRMLHQFIENRFLSRTDISKQLGVPNTAIYAYEKRPTLQVLNLWKICHAVKYNFFMDIANALPEEYERNIFHKSRQDELIAQQAEEIKRLQWENNLMKELLSKK